MSVPFRLLCDDELVSSNAPTGAALNCGDEIGVALSYNFDASDGVLTAGDKVTVALSVDPGTSLLVCLFCGQLALGHSFNARYLLKKTKQMQASSRAISFSNRNK